MLSDFTLLVLVRDRQQNLSKLSKYYEDLHCKKIICDSSLKPYKKIEDLESRGFNYYYWGPMVVWEKRHKAFQLVKTKFVLDNPDDDIAIKDSIKKCVNFLQENDDYSACWGETQMFHLNKKGLSFGTNSVLSDIYAAEILENFKNNDPIKRLHHYFRICPNVFCHAILRTEIGQEIHNNVIKEKKLRHISFIEKLYTIILSMKGNIKYLPILYMLRRKGEKGVLSNQKIYDETRKYSNGGYPECLSKLFEPMIDLFNLHEYKQQIFKTINIKYNKRYVGRKNLKKVRSNKTNFNLKQELGTYFSD